MKELTNGSRHGSETAGTDRSNTESVLDASLSRKSTLVRGELADLEALREESSRKKIIRDVTANFCDHIAYLVQVVKRYPRVAVYTFLVLAILCGCGLSVVFVIANNQNEANQVEALDLATETGRWFCKS